MAGGCFGTIHGPINLQHALPRAGESSLRLVYLCIWRSWAPLKCKIHVWLTVQHRIWTSDRRARHGLQDQPSACFTCLQEEDNAEHIHLQCSYARQVWHKCIVGLNLEVTHPLGHDSLLDWWLQARRNFTRAGRRGFDTLVIAVTWSL